MPVTFDVKLSDGSTREVTGELLNGVAVIHKTINGKGWTVSDLRTGQSFIKTMRTRRDARDFCLEMAKLVRKYRSRQVPEPEEPGF